MIDKSNDHASRGAAPGVDGSSGGVGTASVVFRLDSSSGVPTYVQLVQQVEHALRLGYLQPGDQLPKVRDVVATLAINANTVLKAYRELDVKGLTTALPGQGTFIRATVDPVTLPELAALRRSLRRWVDGANAAGLDHDGIAALFGTVMREFYDADRTSDTGSGRSPDVAHPVGVA